MIKLKRTNLQTNDTTQQMLTTLTLSIKGDVRGLVCKKYLIKSTVLLDEIGFRFIQS